MLSIKLIIKIGEEYGQYQKWLAESNENDSVVSVKLGRVSGLIEALNLLDGRSHNIYEILDLYEELTK